MHLPISKPLFSALLLLVASGCARSFVCPEHGGPAWREVESKHFRIKTDLESADAARVAVQLEKVRRALLLAWGPEFDPPGQVDAIIFANGDAFHYFGDWSHSGMAAKVDQSVLLVMTTPDLLTRSYTDESPLRVQAHELAHELSAHVLLRQPRWLAEGIAQYLETVMISPNGKAAIVGANNRDLLNYLELRHPLQIDALWNWTAPVYVAQTEREFALYASAWAWVHYLIDKQPERFNAFQLRLERGEDPKAAWSATFPPALVKRMNGAVDAYVFKMLPPIAVALPPVPTEVHERPMHDADVHALRAQLWLLGLGSERLEQRKQAIDADLAEALRLDPTNFLAARLQEDIAPEDQKLQLARALARNHPDDADAWVPLMERLDGVSHTGPELEEALAHAEKLGPTSAWALNEIAWVHVERGELEKAEPLARHAVELAPWSSVALDTYAKILVGLDHCDEGLDMQLRAIDLLDEHVSAGGRAVFLHHLEEERQHCAGPAQSADAKQPR